jgi:hypothetical protein
VHQEQRDQKDRPEHREANQIQRADSRALANQMGQRREADDESDAEQQVAADLSPIAGQVRASEVALQRGIIEL